MPSVFQKYQRQNYPYLFDGELEVRNIAGGVPTDPKVAEAWLRSKVQINGDNAIREAVAQTMIERGVTRDEALEMVNANKHLNGFRKDGKGLYIPGAYLKAAIKEAVSVAVNAGKLPNGKVWGVTKKGAKAWFPEHVFVVEDRLYLGVDEPDVINQRFVHTFNGNGIQYEEIVETAHITFQVEADWDIPEDQWATIWTTGQQQGLGASRSLGSGRYDVTKWDRVEGPASGKSRKSQG
jgi:hypothetical protein